MDVSIIKDSSLRIKGNKTAIVIDPLPLKVEAQIAIVTGSSSDISFEKVEGLKLIIEGPGEYEVGGVSVVVKRIKDDLCFDIVENSKILFILSSAISKISQEEDYDAVIIKVNSKLTEDMFSAINSRLYILYGDMNLATLKSENVEKTNRVSLKKAADTSEKIIILGQ